MYSELFCFFADLLINELDGSQFIFDEADSIYVEDGCLVFSLKGLYNYLFESGQSSYTEFRRMLYSSTLNNELAELGGRVDVYRSSSKVETSLYCLVKLKE